MGSERNPQLASILWALKNSSEAGKEPSAVPNSVSHASSNSTAVIKQPPQIDRSLATAHPGRRPAQLSADPSKITTWAPAQKYVIENIYSNQAQTLRIKQLITNQQCQEKRWWAERDRKSTRLNSSHSQISYAVFCLKKKKPAAHARSIGRRLSDRTGPVVTDMVGLFLEIVFAGSEISVLVSCLNRNRTLVALYMLTI